MIDERAGLPSEFSGWRVYWSDGKGSYDRSFGPHENGQAWAFFAERVAQGRELSKRESAKQGMRLLYAAYINMVVG